MIEQVDYHILQRERGSASSARIKFRFGQEVAPKDRVSVRERYKHLKEYMRTYEDMMIWHNNTARSNNLGKSIKVVPYWFRLGFDVVVEADGTRDLEKMLDFVALNSFVLTGKRPEEKQPK